MNFNEQSFLCHHGILGMKWGVRRYQNKDGSLTPEGRKRYDGRYSDIRYKISTGPAKPAKQLVKKVNLNKEETLKRYSEMLDKKQVEKSAKKELKKTSKRVSKLKKTVNIGILAGTIGTSIGYSVLANKITAAYPGLGMSVAMANVIVAGASQTLLSAAVNYAGNKKVEKILEKNNIRLSQIKIPKKLTIEEIEEIMKRETDKNYAI